MQGPGGSWKVEEKIPLKAIFFLEQSPDDFAAPVGKAHAKAMIIETLEHVTRSNLFTLKEKEDLVKNFIKRANSLAGSIPAFRLKLSLTGEFWQEMERALLSVKTHEKIEHKDEVINSKKMMIKERKNKGCSHFVYRGVSMNPAFVESEMITVIPYGSSRIRTGDVVCYKTDANENVIVHRVVGIKGTRIKTKGDNNASPDPFTIESDDIIGRVCSSRREGRIRRVYGGAAGLAVMLLARLYKPAVIFASRMLHNSYCSISRTGIMRKLLPENKQIDVAVFERQNIKYPKIIFSGKTIGRYSQKYKKWHIKRPYRIFVDEAMLPDFKRSSRIKKEE
jgi:signal peptidase I